MAHSARLPRLTPLFKVRAVMSVFIIGLVLSGVTAFPLLHELRLLSQFVDYIGGPTESGLSIWIHHVHAGLEDMYGEYPWIAYGTDWLAFGHIVIAMFFIGPWLDPVNSRSILITGMVACVLVISPGPHLWAHPRHTLLLATHRLQLRRIWDPAAAVLPEAAKRNRTRKIRCVVVGNGSRKDAKAQRITTDRHA